MKKKQLAKLKQQFRPSYETARQQLFTAIERKTADKFDLPTTVYINPKNQEELLIELLKETPKEQKIAVPLDENFKIVVKRIQRLEAGLLDRFSDNLVDEIAAYWLKSISLSRPKRISSASFSVIPGKLIDTPGALTPLRDPNIPAFLTTTTNSRVASSFSLISMSIKPSSNKMCPPT